MNPRTKVIEIELSRPLKSVFGQHEYSSLRALIRWHGTPIGYINLPVCDGFCSASAFRDAIIRQHGNALMRAIIRKRIERPLDNWPIRDTNPLIHREPTPNWDTLPLVTVAVCTRNRTSQLKDCLEAITQLNYERLEILVIDNAPDSNDTERLVLESFPNVRYVFEQRPGLDWARNRAIQEAKGEILAYTDDDVIVDPQWVNAFVEIFIDDPNVMAITGLVAPYELETHAQILFERSGGFGRGFLRQWYTLGGEDGHGKAIHIGSGRFGTGANMAYRRGLFANIGGFDPGLDVGTVTNGGGDLEMFFRVLEEGHTLVYEPAALVWHRHRESLKELRVQLENNGVGLYSYFVRSALNYPNRRWEIMRFALWWMWYGNLRRLLKSFFSPPNIPRRLLWAEFRGSLTGLTRYPAAKRRADEIASTHKIPSSFNSRVGIPPQKY